ncbi:hypothetical protein N7527_001719 [Penicillium freii]|nr:hypothetical protein N7527_001719 [Penicillium freii]
MADLGSPSPSIKSDLSTFERQVSLKSILESYQASHSADDTLFFLQIVFKYLPSDGQRNLIEDLSGCQDDNAIRQHAESLDAGLLRPILSIGGKTPAITPSPRTPRLDDSIENLNSFDGQTVTQIDQQQLRRNCLARDGYQCVLTKCWDVGTTPYPPDDLYTRCKQFISFRPSSGGLEPTTSKIELLRDVNREDNILMMASVFHEDFSKFRFILEATIYPTETLITLTTHDDRFRDPNPEFLAVHADIGNILHASGRAENIEKLLRDFEDADPLLATDGSTDISGLLSVSRLSVLSSHRNTIDDAVIKANQGPVQAEIQKPEDE